MVNVQGLSVACTHIQCEEYGKRFPLNIQQAYALRVARDMRICAKCGQPQALLDGASQPMGVHKIPA